MCTATVERRWLRPASRGKLAAMALSAALFVPGSLVFSERFDIGLDTQIIACLYEDVFLIDTHDHGIERGGLVAFATDERTEPLFEAGTRLVKRVVGLPGDHVAIRPVAPDPSMPRAILSPSEHGRVQGRPRALFNYAIEINGKPHGRGGLNSLHVTGGDPEDYVRELVVGDGEVFVMGDTAVSFDSRYWGPMRLDQIVGKAYALW